MSFNLTTAGKVTRVMNAVAAGTTDQNSSSVDMKSFDSVTFYVSFGTIVAAAVTSVKAQTSSDDSTFNDLKGTSITVADTNDNDVVALEIVRPLERYIRCTVDRGTQNATIDGIIAVQTRADKEPVTHDSSTVVGSEVHASPIEGTA